MLNTAHTKQDSHMKLHDKKVDTSDDGYCGSTTYHFAEHDDNNCLSFTGFTDPSKGKICIKSETFGYEATVGEITDTMNRLRTTKHLAEFSSVLVNDIINPLVSGLHLVSEEDANCATRAIVNTNIAEALLPRTLTIINPYDVATAVSSMLDDRSLYNGIDDDIKAEIENELTDILSGDSKSD